MQPAIPFKINLNDGTDNNHTRSAPALPTTLCLLPLPSQTQGETHSSSFSISYFTLSFSSSFFFFFSRV